MELILTQKYTSWSLPKKTTIFLTNNPDDGSFNVNSLDKAQRSRFLNYGVEFDINAWAAWAEKAHLDSRCINFVLQNHDALFQADENGNQICNPRSYVMFARTIEGITDWDTDENRSFISMIAAGTFFDESNKFAQMFDIFIRKKMHLLIEPKKMLEGSWTDVQQDLEKTVYNDNGTFRPEIASILEKRFSNYVSAWLENDGKHPIKIVIDRILAMKRNGRMIFTEDQFYHMIKTITSEHKSQTNKLLYEPELARIISA